MWLEAGAASRKQKARPALDRAGLAELAGFGKRALARTEAGRAFPNWRLLGLVLLLVLDGLNRRREGAQHEEASQEQSGQDIGEEVAPEDGFDLHPPEALGDEDEEVAEEPDAQQAAEEGDLGPSETNEGPLRDHIDGKAEDGEGINIEGGDGHL